MLNKHMGEYQEIHTYFIMEDVRFFYLRQASFPVTKYVGD